METTKNGMVNAAMLIVAKQVAEEHGYIQTGFGNIDARRDWFWANRFIGATSPEPVVVTSATYILPLWEDELAKYKRRPKIGIDMFLGRPRLNIDLPDGTFACLTYENGLCKEAQAFGEHGIAFALSIKDKIDYYLKIL